MTVRKPSEEGLVLEQHSRLRALQAFGDDVGHCDALDAGNGLEVLRRGGGGLGHGRGVRVDARDLEHVARRAGLSRLGEEVPAGEVLAGHGGLPDSSRSKRDSPVNTPSALPKAATTTSSHAAATTRGCRATSAPRWRAPICGSRGAGRSRGIACHSWDWAQTTTCCRVGRRARPRRGRASDASLPPPRGGCAPGPSRRSAGRPTCSGRGAPLRRLIEGSGGTVAGPLSAIIWGPPRTGSTTPAQFAATAAERRFVELSAVTRGQGRAGGHGPGGPRARHVRPPDGAVPRRDPPVHQGTAGRAAARGGEPAGDPGGGHDREPLLLDHRPLLSRSMLITLGSLSDAEVADVVASAVSDARAWRAISSSSPRRLHTWCGSRVGTPGALTSLEARGVALDDLAPGRQSDEPAPITLAHVEQAVAHAAVRYDKTGDQHYDVASALIKSMRGSDVDAALHYLARMLEAGEDPRFIARRIVISASEDVGMADPTALQTAVAALHAVAQIGMPRRGSSSRRPSSTTRSRRSPTRPTSASTRRSPTSGPGAEGRSRRTCGGAGMPVRPGSGTARAMSTPTTRRTASPSSSTSQTTSRAARTTTVPPAGASRSALPSAGSGSGAGSAAPEDASGRRAGAAVHSG